MKKVLLTIILAMLLVAAFATPALAAEGAVKADMVVHTDSGTDEMPAGTMVGSVILNTTASGWLIVVVNLDDAWMLEDDPDTADVDEGVYDSLVWINGQKVSDQVALDVLDVNHNGQATANYKVDLSMVDGIGADDTEIAVNVVVRPSFGPNTTPCYVNGPNWQTDIIVPLK